MIDLLVTGIGAVVGGGFGVLGRRVSQQLNLPFPQVSRFSPLIGAVMGGVAGMIASTPPSTAARLEAAAPAMRAIHRYYPETFAEVVAVVDRAGPTDAVELQNRVRPVVTALIAAHRSEIDDTTAEAMGRLMIEEAQALEAANPDACLAIVAGKPIDVEIGAVISPEDLRRDSETAAKLIEQVATHPAPPASPLSEAEVQTLATRALAKLPNGAQDIVSELAAQHRTPGTPREASAFCAFQRARLTAAMEGGPGILRRLLVG